MIYKQTWNNGTGIGASLFEWTPDNNNDDDDDDDDNDSSDSGLSLLLTRKL